MIHFAARFLRDGSLAVSNMESMRIDSSDKLNFSCRSRKFASFDLSIHSFTMETDNLSFLVVTTSRDLTSKEAMMESLIEASILIRMRFFYPGPR